MPIKFRGVSLGSQRDPGRFGSGARGGHPMMSAAMDGHSGQSGAAIHGRRHHKNDRNAGRNHRPAWRSRRRPEPAGGGRRVHRSRRQRMHRISNDLGGAAEPLAAQPARRFRQNQRAGPSPMVWTLGRCADMAVPLANIGRRAVSAAMVRFRRAAGPLIERSFSF